jgi:hypothetical protein
LVIIFPFFLPHLLNLFQYTKARATLITGFQAQQVDPQTKIIKDSSEKKNLGDNYVDASVIEALNWDIVDASSDIAQNTLAAFDKYLSIASRPGVGMSPPPSLLPGFIQPLSSPSSLSLLSLPLVSSPASLGLLQPPLVSSPSHRSPLATPFDLLGLLYLPLVSSTPLSSPFFHLNPEQAMSATNNLGGMTDKSGL